MLKRSAALAAALCLALSTLVSAAGAASCFPRYTGASGSIAVALDALGADPSYASRAEIAAANGIGGYRGTAAPNTPPPELLREGEDDSLLLAVQKKYQQKKAYMEETT